MYYQILFHIMVFLFLNLFHPVPAVSGIPLVYAWIRRGTCCYSMHSHGYARYCSLPVVSNMLLGQHGALLARPNPNAYCAAYTLALQHRMRCSPTVKLCQRQSLQTLLSARQGPAGPGACLRLGTRGRA